MLIQRQKTIVSVNLVHWLKNNIVISKCKHAYSPGCVTLNAQYRMRRSILEELPQHGLTGKNGPTTKKDLPR